MNYRDYIKALPKDQKNKLTNAILEIYDPKYHIGYYIGPFKLINIEDKYHLNPPDDIQFIQSLRLLYDDDICIITKKYKYHYGDGVEKKPYAYDVECTKTPHYINNLFTDIDWTKDTDAIPEEYDILVIDNGIVKVTKNDISFYIHIDSANNSYCAVELRYKTVPEYILHN